MQEAYSVLGNVKDRKLYDIKNSSQSNPWENNAQQYGRRYTYEEWQRNAQRDFREHVKRGSRRQGFYYEWTNEQRQNKGSDKQQQNYYKWTYSKSSKEPPKSDDDG